MEPGHYTDPLEEALSRGSQQVAQFASLVGAAAQVIWQHKALRDARNTARGDQRATAILDQQERLLRQQARLGWAAAHDPQWLSHADLLHTGRAWAAAASATDADPAAESAMRKCEDRLRGLHPYAMARYDRLREDGVNPIDAMRETTPLFSRAPFARTGEPGPDRASLLKGTGNDTQPRAGEDPARADAAQESSDRPVASPDAVTEKAEVRGRQIAERLQARARTARRRGYTADELTVVLEAATNLPDDEIERIVRGAATEDSAQAGRYQSAAQLAAVDFPVSASDVVRAAVKSGTNGPVDTPVSAHRPKIARPPGPTA